MDSKWMPLERRGIASPVRRASWLLALVVLVPVSTACADLSAPGPYGAGWVEVEVSRPAGGSFDARLFYPAAGSGQGAPYDGGGAPYPAISFGHGWITAVTRYQSTLEHLASWGYFVIASKSYGGLFPDHSAFADDMRWCLTYLEEENATPGSMLHLQVDTLAFGLSGHSMGGGASLLAAARDGRVRVVANLAAAETNPSAIAAIADVRVPLCLVAGDEDSIVPPSGHTIPMYDAASAPRRLPLLDGGFHCGFLDSSFIGCDSGSLPREDQLALTRGLLTGFHNLYLKDDQTVWRQVWGPELDAEPLIDNARVDPGITVEPHDPGLVGYPGQLVEAEITLTNQGPLAASYQLFLEGNTWPTIVTPTQTSVLEPGGSTQVMLRVEIPLGADPDIDVTLYSARSDVDGGTRAFGILSTERRRLGDFDANGVVDAEDYAPIAACLTGPGVTLVSGCEGADLDFDCDCDLEDIARFQNAYGASE
jgi:dienelactone hydrolase